MTTPTLSPPHMIRIRRKMVGISAILLHFTADGRVDDFCHHVRRTTEAVTTAPCQGMVSGCYPLDEFYKARPENERRLEIKPSVKE